MPNYTKLFNSIVTSTIWTEDDKTRIVWITMLALADQNGEVQSSIPGLARLAGVAIADVEAALEKFLSPDAYSRTPDNDGRRIAKIEGGWELLNHAKYRRMASLADQRDSNAKRQQRHRDRNAPVTHSNASVTVETDIADAEAKADAEVIPHTKKKAAGAVLPFPENWSTVRKQAMRDWIDYKRERGMGYKPTGWKALCAKLEAYTDPKIVQCVSDSMANNWNGLFPDSQDRSAKPAPAPFSRNTGTANEGAWQNREFCDEPDPFLT